MLLDLILDAAEIVLHDFHRGVRDDAARRAAIAVELPCLCDRRDHSLGHTSPFLTRPISYMNRKRAPIQMKKNAVM